MSKKFDELVKIMEILRSEKGCPWDRVQTHDTLKRYLLEETYELIEAIENKEPESIKEELGDLLLQIVFHSQIAKEECNFDVEDVIQTIIQKMIGRHPHVFGEAEFKTPEEVLNQWDDRKREEGKLHESILDGVPKALPALLKAYKIQSRVAKVGFDWDNIGGVIDKIKEELGEVEEAINSGEKDKIEEEIGDLLFSIVNLARFLKIDPETALRKTNRKFEKRFRKLENLAKNKGKTLKDMTLKEMDNLWDEIKNS
ncbi:tetrapyrrole methylase family protein [Thermodesulfovibrio aggregans]|uniref:Nucleoside triphosphate pyrophosphohydrolase n=1 Tax=Thermodesulfovibrio aggregans TaxID=86166 RepID=A0A0U9HM94_9BACT|nr:nucleoside triphosphate pyrophosphohydrolase [Thermodesulfovibrio aggregans]GAQ94211.1 tetrapyrrole methylase family protein [Thermodesulfovibrio aggregans]